MSTVALALYLARIARLATQLMVPALLLVFPTKKATHRKVALKVLLMWTTSMEKAAELCVSLVSIVPPVHCPVSAAPLDRAQQRLVRPLAQVTPTLRTKFVLRAL